MVAERRAVIEGVEMCKRWLKSEPAPDAKSSFLASKLFGPCRAAKHDECAVQNCNVSMLM